MGTGLYHVVRRLVALHVGREWLQCGSGGCGGHAVAEPARKKVRPGSAGDDDPTGPQPRAVRVGDAAAIVAVGKWGMGNAPIDPIISPPLYFSLL